MLEFVKKSILAGAGLAVMTAEKVQELFDELVKKGEISEKEAKETVSELLEKSKEIKNDMQDWVNKAVTAVLQRLQVPTREEIDEIRARLERLEKPRGEEKDHAS